MALSAEPVFSLVGLFLLGCSWDQWRQRQPASSLFWGLLALLFGLGPALGARLSGVLVVALVLVDASGKLKPNPRPPMADTPVRGVVWPVLAIAACLMLTGVLAPRLGLDATQGAALGLGLGSLVGGALALRLTGDSFSQLVHCGSNLNQTIGSVSLLPQLLASLGAVLAAAQLGPRLAGWFGQLGGGSALAAVLVTCLCMVALAALTGNSFAAYPVIAGGFLLPLLALKPGSDPSALAVWTLMVGASGTLLTPMAANFNLVPAALLDLEDRYAVLKAQWPFALGMLLAHLLFMSLV